MSTQDSTACPQCQGPRDSKALYCPFCGAVFSRLAEKAAPAAPPRAAPPAAAAPGTAGPPSPPSPPAPPAPAAPATAPPTGREPRHSLAPIESEPRPAAAPGDLYDPAAAPPSPRSPDVASLHAPPPAAQPYAAPPSTAPPSTAPPSTAAPAAPSTADNPHGLPDIYDGSPPAATVPGAASPGGRPLRRLPALGSEDDVVDTPLNRSLLLSVLVAGLLWAFLQVFMYEHVGSGSEDLGSVQNDYTAATGLVPPSELTDGSRVTFIGHHILFLVEERLSDNGPATFPSFVLVYYRGLLAGQTDGETMKRDTHAKIEEFGIPLYPISRRTTVLRGREVPTEIYGVGSPEQSAGRVVYRTITGPGGQTVLVVVGGTTKNVTQLTRGYFS